MQRVNRPNSFSKEENSGMGLEKTLWFSVIFQIWPEDSSGCAGKCFYKRCLAAYVVKDLCSLEISVVLQLHLP